MLTTERRRRRPATPCGLSPERLLAAIVASSDDAIVAKSLDGRVMSWNAAAERLFGYRADEMLGQPIQRLFPPERLGEENEIVSRIARGERVDHFETERHHRDGHLVQLSVSVSPIMGDHGRVIAASKIARDISGRVEAERQIWHLAHHDPLTQLPNRRLFCDRLSLALADAAARSEPLALMFIDLDGFKQINDSLGHAAGDQVLVEVARRLSQAVRAGDLVARLGGDEFVVLLPAVGSPADALALGRRLVEALAAPHDLAGDLRHATGSVGLTLSPARGGSSDELLSRADKAVYQAKRQGRNQVCLLEAGEAHSGLQAALAAEPV